MHKIIFYFWENDGAVNVFFVLLRIIYYIGHNIPNCLTPKIYHYGERNECYFS